MNYWTAAFDGKVWVIINEITGEVVDTTYIRESEARRMAAALNRRYCS